MTEMYSIRAYWGPRKESIESCTVRAVDFFQRVVDHGAFKSSWFKKGQSRRKALEQGINVLNREEIAELLNKGVNRRDLTKEAIKELGFHINLWNGEKGRDVAALSLVCGNYSRAEGMGNNFILLELPEDLGGLSSSEQMLRLFTIVIEVWRPERACVCSDDAADERNFDTGRHFVDWMVYVSGASLNPKYFPQAFGVLPAHSGTIIVVEPEAPNSSSTAHQQKVREIEHRLNRVLKT